MCTRRAATGSRRPGGGGLDPVDDRRDRPPCGADGVTCGIRGDHVRLRRGGRWPRAAAGRRRGGWVAAAPAGGKPKTAAAGGGRWKRQRSWASHPRAQTAPAGEHARPAATRDDRCFRGTGRWTERPRGSSPPNLPFGCAAPHAPHERSRNAVTRGAVSAATED